MPLLDSPPRHGNWVFHFIPGPSRYVAGTGGFTSVFDLRVTR